MEEKFAIFAVGIVFGVLVGVVLAAMVALATTERIGPDGLHFEQGRWWICELA